jgi:ribonuclease MRP protein subunit RMP1
VSVTFFPLRLLLVLSSIFRRVSYLKGILFWSTTVLSLRQLSPAVSLASTLYIATSSHLSTKHLAELLISYSLASYRAFSTLIADRQFSTLGVVLLAILARVGKVVGLPEPAPPTVSDVRPGQHTNTILATSLTQAGVDTGEVVERVFDGRELEDSGLVVSREGRMALMATMIKDGEAGKQSGKGNFLDTEPIRGEDEGVTESLMASADDGEPGKGAQSTSEALAHGGLADKPPAVAERKRKRRKKGNAIDELFAGLP